MAKRDRQELLASIATMIADYRRGDIPEPNANHVERWIDQFDEDVQLPLMRELSHTLVSSFFAHHIRHDGLAGADPCRFWREAHLLNIQQQGRSQSEIRDLFGRALEEQCGIESLDDCGSANGAFIYLDDVLFTGSRIGNDLAAWIVADAPTNATVHILVIATHRFGEWKCSERLKNEAAKANRRIAFNIWAALRLENRVHYQSSSEVLWPAVIPDDDALKAYVAEEQRFPFKPRMPGGKLEHDLFSSEAGRQLLEREFLLAGMRIRSFCRDPSRSLRPLGFSPFGLGFGSTIVTYRNCPNNAPLALWWGNPDAPKHHPFSKWYPLLPRSTYGQEDEFNDAF
jgi:hypothetical protein